jgi:6-phosphogluconolactonase
MMMEERRFTTLPAAAHALAGELAVTLDEAISARGRALLAVSGGHTPQKVLERLRQLEVDWSRVTLTLTDERWVRPDHPDSNEALVRSCLLRGPAAAAAFVPLFGGEASPEAGQPACEARLKALALPFDAVYLGMGSDGHFASLFPCDPAIDADDSLCVAVPATESRLPRISLAAPTILNTRKVYLLFSGAGKLAIYTEAKKPGSYRDIPLRLVLSQAQTPVMVLIAP